MGACVMRIRVGHVREGTCPAYTDVGGLNLELGCFRWAQLGSWRTRSSYLHLTFTACWDVDFLEPDVFLAVEP